MLERNLWVGVWIGFAVASAGYRYTYNAPYPGMFQDCIDAIDFLRQHASDYRLDADRIGLCGISASGHVAALIGTVMGGSSDFERSDRPIQALVDWCGWTDVTLETAGKHTGGFPHIYPNRTYDPIVAKKISAAHQVQGRMPPVLIQHGEKDTAVPIQQAKLFLDKLKQAGHDASLVTYPAYDHNIWQPDVHAAALEFFKKHLKAEGN